jgi:hypothetical protein
VRDESHLDKKPCCSKPIDEKKHGLNEKSKSEVQTEGLDLIDVASFKFNSVDKAQDKEASKREILDRLDTSSRFSFDEDIFFIELVEVLMLMSMINTDAIKNVGILLELNSLGVGD